MTSLAEIAQYVVMRRRDVSESSSSDSDEEWEAVLRELSKLSPQKSLRLSPKGENIFNIYSDEEFKKHFRLSRDTFNYVHQLIEKDLNRRTCMNVAEYPTLPSRRRLMVALWQMVTGETCDSVSVRLGLSERSVRESVGRVTQALRRRTEEFLAWPRGKRTGEVMRGFQLISSGFPRVLGAVSSVCIPAPASQGYIRLQLVCDHKQLITHCSVGGGRDTHESDQQVLKSSELSRLLNKEDNFPEDSHLLGSGEEYQLQQHLLTPYSQTGEEPLTERQLRYNGCHSACRAVIDGCIGSLKARFRSLLTDCLPLSQTEEFLLAASVLHNICIMRKDTLRVLTLSGAPQGKSTSNPQPPSKIGIRKRNDIMLSL